MNISKLEKIANQLKGAGESVSTQMLMTKILVSLPNNYKHFISARESVAEKEKTMNNFISRLLVEESHAQKLEVQENVALISQGKRFNGKYPPKRSYCKKKGHEASECYQLKRYNNDYKIDSKKDYCNKTSSENHECFYCHKKGHIIGDCRI